MDPAFNLASTSRSKGHHIVVGFWGEESVSQQLPDSFDVIIAQNVVAHVPQPCHFVSMCKLKMVANTKLYIQTSQADIFTTGEFDTIYHEHISFFTISSMYKLAERCGLFLEHVEKVPIHGTVTSLLCDCLAQMTLLSAIRYKK